MATWLRRRFDGGVGPEYVTLIEYPRRRARPRSRPTGRPPRASIGRRRSTRECWSSSARVASPKPRSASRRVCRRHRTEPPHRPARSARADDRRRRRACPRRCTTSSTPRARAARPSCCPPATAPRSTSSAEKFHGAYADIRDFLSELAFLPPEEFADHLYVHYDADAVAHLFAVAAGLDSAVLGEAEILGQVRAAWERAQAEERRRLVAQPAVPPRPRGRQAGPHRDRHRPPHRLGVAPPRWPWPPSASAALDGRRVLVLGAGDMGEGMVRSLADARRRRRPHRQPHLGAGRRAGRPGRRPGRSASPTSTTSLAEVDLLLTGTGASSMHARARRRRPGSWQARDGRPLLVVDVAVPRDVDPAAADLAGVTLLDMDDLRAFAEAGQAERRREVAAVRDDRRRRARALRRASARPARSPRWSPRCASGPRPSARPSSTASAAKLGELDERQRRGRRGAHPRHRGQAAARAHRRAQGRGRHAQGRAPGRGPPRPLRPLSRRPIRGRAGGRTSGPRPAAARWPAGRPTTSPRLLAAVGRARASRSPSRRSSSRPSADRRLDIPIWEMGGKGVFVKEVQAAVLDGRADLAVHSGKDLPGAHPRRPGARRRARAGRPPRRAGRARPSPASPAARMVATGSVRRRAQLAWLRPDLTFAGLRGNIATRLAKASDGSTPS